MHYDDFVSACVFFFNLTHDEDDFVKTPEHRRTPIRLCDVM